MGKGDIGLGLLLIGGLFLLSRGIPKAGAVRPKTNQQLSDGKISIQPITQAPDATAAPHIPIMSSGITRGEIRGEIGIPPNEIGAFLPAPAPK